MSRKVPESTIMYIRELAERLEQGRAVVMVGAGFSKNAIPKVKTNKKFLSWNELGDLFYEKLYGIKPDKNVTHYLDALKLASMVETSLGRTVLDKILLDNLPDDEYEPSNLHLKLLGLNWADIFTTNYDTLLERTRSHVPNRKYQVVLNKDDLVYSQCPRIIKLHGSFPSTRPFIITEEDYRKYPKEFSIFVNTVQQALIENVMCLIGFSGDDPNFLNWIGWIHDNLGKSVSSKIYMVEFSKKSPAEIALMESRNIQVINLAECFDDGKLDYQEGLDIFLTNLQEYQRKNRKDLWPPKKYDIQFQNVKDIMGKNVGENISLYYRKWVCNHDAYPGWIVMPYKYRKSIIKGLEDILYFLELYKDKTYAKDILPIKYLYEVDWIRKNCLISLNQKMVFEYERIISMEKVEEVDSKYIIDIIFSMLEYYRRHGMFKKWDEWAAQIDRYSLDTRQNIYYYCEKAYKAFYSMDYEELTRLLCEWPDLGMSVELELVHFGMLVETGRLKQSISLINKILDNARSQLSAGADYRVLSQEAYAMYLMGSVAKYRKFIENDKQVIDSFEDGDRAKKLRVYDCYPESEVEYFNLLLNSEEKNLKPAKESRLFISEQYINFMERTGGIFRITYLNASADATRNAIYSLSEENLFLSVMLVFRAQERNIVRKVWNKYNVSKYSMSEVDNLIKFCLDACKRNVFYMPRAKNKEIIKSLSIYVPEIISIFVFNTSDMVKLKIIKSLDIFLENTKIFENIEKLYINLCKSITPEFLKTNFNDIITLPILKIEKKEIDGLMVPCIGEWNVTSFDAKDLYLIIAKLKLKIDTLDKESYIRKSSIYRLLILQINGFLDNDIVKWLKNIILDDINNNITYSLPLNKLVYRLFQIDAVKDEIKNTLLENFVCQFKQFHILIHSEEQCMEDIFNRYVEIREFARNNRGGWKEEDVNKILLLIQELQNYKKEWFIPFSLTICERLLFYMLSDMEKGLSTKLTQQLIRCEKLLLDQKLKRVRLSFSQLIEQKFSISDKQFNIVLSGIYFSDFRFVSESLNYFLFIEKDFQGNQELKYEYFRALELLVKQNSEYAIFIVDSITEIVMKNNGQIDERCMKVINNILLYLSSIDGTTEINIKLQVLAAELAHVLKTLGRKNKAIEVWQKKCTDAEEHTLIRQKWII